MKVMVCKNVSRRLFQFDYAGHTFIANYVQCGKTSVFFENHN